MEIKMRDYQWGKDFESVRQFLADIFSVRQAYTNWIPSELENLKFGPGGTKYRDEEDEYLKIWEASNEPQGTLKIVAVSYTKSSGSCWLSIHPDYMPAAKEIVLWMRNRVKKLKASKLDEVKMRFVIDDNDKSLICLVSDLGFEQGEVEGDKQIWPTDLPAPTYTLPEGYTIRNAVIEKDFQEYREVQKSVFPHIKSMSKDILRLYAMASFYQEDLDIAAIDLDGRFAAFCTGRIDPLSRIAELEPVGTHPDHRKLGLARAVICESLKRLEKYRPSVVVVLGAAPTDGARRLYKSLGFVNEGTRHYWCQLI